MKHLDSTTEQIRWYLGGAITTNKLHCDANWIDDPASAATPGSTQSESNDTTPVTAVAAPASLQRIVIDMAICNRDTAAATVTVERYDGTDRRDLLTVTLAAGSTLQYVKDSGWSVIKTDGSNPGAGGGGGGDALTTDPLSQFAATTSLQLKGVISDETGSGALVFATSPTLVTPLLGTPTSGTLTNCTGLPIAGGGTGGTTAATARAALGAANTTFSWEWVWGPRVHRATAGTLGGTDSNLSDNTDMDGCITGVNCADAARTDCFFQFTVPTEIDVSAAITAIVYYRIGAAGTGTAVEIEMTARAIADNEVNVSGGTLFTVGGGACIKSVDTYASGDLVVHSIGEVFGAASLSAQELVHGCFFRDAQAGNADDTFANTIMLAAVRFTGTRLTT